MEVILEPLCRLGHEEKREWLVSYLKTLDYKIFVETGTFQGATVRAVRDMFDLVYSIELADHYYKGNVKQFKNDPNVVLLHGDSARHLNTLVPKMNLPCAFWLDAHYSGGNTALGDTETPITRELDALSKHRHLVDSVILIDDAIDFGQGDYPKIYEVMLWAQEQGFNHFDCINGIMRIS